MEGKPRGIIWKNTTVMETNDDGTVLITYSSSLSTERMERLTKAGGGEECGAPGDLVNWEEIEWSNHSEAKARLDSHAKVIEVDRELEGPCRREYKVKLFMTIFAWHHQCMTHCQKI